MATPAESFQKIKCYSDGVGDMAILFKESLTDPDTGQFKKIDFNVIRQIVGGSFDELDQTLRECTGDGFKDDLRRLFASGDNVGLVLALRLVFEILGISLEDTNRNINVQALIKKAEATEK